MQAFALILGAIGALLAIFLKEAVQHALQRRVIAWQLGGHLMSWKQQLVRVQGVASALSAVEGRLKELEVSYSSGTKEFEQRYLQQKKDQEEIRKRIKSELREQLAKREEPLVSAFERRSCGLAAELVAESRKQLADSKTFISDRDAAMLGRAAAMNVVQFRTAAIGIAGLAEGAFKLMADETTPTAPDAVVDQFVDQVVIQGEDLLAAFVRLERQADRISKQSVVRATLEVLRGG